MHLEILADPTSQLTLDDVTSDVWSKRFTASQEAIPSFGYTNAAYWVRFRLRNEASRWQRWRLEYGFANMHYLDLYIPAPNGSGFVSRYTGTFRPYATRDIKHHRFVFEVDLPLRTERTIYLRFKSGAVMTLPLTLWSLEAFAQASAAEHLKLGMIYGILILMLAYNLFLFIFSLREASFFYYVLLVASFIFMQASYDGMAQRYVLPHVVEWGRLILLFAGLTTMAMLKFFDTIMLTKEWAPRFHRLFIILFALCSLEVLLTPFVSYHHLVRPVVLTLGFTLVAIWVISLFAWRQGNRSVRLFLLAWLIVPPLGALNILARFDWFPHFALFDQIYFFRSTSIMIMWSLGLVDRINLLKSETEQANQGLRQSERRLTQFLDAIPIGVTVHDVNERPYYHNRQAQVIFQLPVPKFGHPAKSDAGGNLAYSPSRLFVRGTQQIYPAEREPMRHALRGEPMRVDDIEIEREGGRIPLEVWSSPIFDENGNVSYAISAFQDITERVRVNQLLEQRVEERTQELGTLLDVSHHMAATLELEPLIDLVLDQLHTVIAYDGATILTLEGEALTPLAHRGRVPIDAITRMPISIAALPDNGVWLKQLREPFSMGSTPELSAIAQYLQSLVHGTTEPGRTQFQGWLVAPLLIKGQMIGLLILWRHESDYDGPEQAKLALAFGQQVAVAVENARLYQRAQAAAAAEERERLARELHDSVTQSLFSATLVADALPQLWHRNPGDAQQALEDLRRLTQGALAEMRTMLLELRPAALAETSLSTLLQQLTQAVTGRLTVQVTVHTDEVPMLADEVKIGFYRIGQEALNNIVKHALAREISVDLIVSPHVQSGSKEDWQGQIVLQICDDGRGFDPEQVVAGRLGLSIMRERAAGIGATLEIASQVQHGTQVTVTWVTPEA